MEVKKPCKKQKERGKLLAAKRRKMEVDNINLNVEERDSITSVKTWKERTKAECRPRHNGVANEEETLQQHNLKEVASKECKRNGKVNQITQRNPIEVTNSSILDTVSLTDSASPGLCRFACLDCSATFKTWMSLVYHRKNVHNKLTKKKEVEAYLFKASAHVCQICSKKVLNDSQFLTNHFYVHGTTLNKYRLQYNTRQKEAPWKASFREILTNAELSQDKIGNFCTFRCPQCKNVFENYGTFRKHTTTTSAKCPLPEGMKPYEKYLEKVVAHKCKICSKLLLCDNEVIKKHIDTSHSLNNVGQYARKTGCTWLPIKYHLNGVDDIFKSKTATLSVIVGNCCIFTCDHCDKRINNWLHMRQHVKEKHGFSNVMWHQYISKVVLHQCKICKNKVLCDKEFIKKHVSNHHKLKLSAYELKYT